MARRKPFYSLKLVKQKVRENDWRATKNAQDGAWFDFEWDLEKMGKCLLKLNDRDYELNRSCNHFFKSDPFNKEPHIMLDFYKAYNIQDGEDVYMHLYIREEDGKLIVNSFHHLE
jgi:hypothetical protein